MRFCLMHLEDDGSTDELAVIVPGAGRVAMMVPLDGLAAFLPILQEATAELGEQRCTACAAPLPGLRRSGADGG